MGIRRERVALQGSAGRVAASRGSVTVAAVGLTMYVHGATKVDDAEEELCARGAYPADSGCPMPSMRITQSELDRLNAKGARGETIAQIGVVTTGAAVAVAGFALYKGFIKPKQETVIVAPMTTTRIRLPTRIPWRFNGQKCDIVLHQLRTVDRTRLSQRIGVLEPTIARQVLAALQQLFASPAEPESPPAG